MSLLSIRDVHVHLRSGDQNFTLLNGVSFDVERGEIYGLIGETGAGKSLTAWASIGLLPARARIVSGSITFNGQELVGLGEDRLQRIRGNDIGLIVQNPKGSLHPLRSVGRQIAALRRQHRGGSRKEAMASAIAALEAVGVPDAPRRARSLPHELSGGMAQRVLIAAAMVNDPALIIADEPTTGLDVTVQAQILESLRAKVDERGVSILLITHDLGVVAQFCDRVGVMFGGRVVEEAPVRELFGNPRHPYTRALIAAAQPQDPDSAAVSDLGLPPNLAALPAGCHYAYRCPWARPQCERPVPETKVADTHRALCLFADRPNGPGPEVTA